MEKLGARFCCYRSFAFERVYERPGAKTGRNVNVCVLQSVGEEEGEGKVTIPEDIKKCCLMFGHPEVFDSRGQQECCQNA